MEEAMMSMPESSVHYWGGVYDGSGVHDRGGVHDGSGVHYRGGVVARGLVDDGVETVKKKIKVRESYQNHNQRLILQCNENASV